MDMMKAVVGQCLRILRPRGSMVIVIQPILKRTVGCGRGHGISSAGRQGKSVWYRMPTGGVRTRCPGKAVRSVCFARPSSGACGWDPLPHPCQDRVLWDMSKSMPMLAWEDRAKGSHGCPSSHSANWQTMGAAMLARGRLPLQPFALFGGGYHQHYGHPATLPYAVADWWTHCCLVA